ncbi:MAG: response regulator [Bacteroidetes bacterium]|nr:response regulator [Bacteroidota bacterium]
MENKISILHLEDQLADSVIIKSMISKAFGTFDYYFVDDEDSFIKALEEKKIDVILSDYELPDYSGSDALQLAKERYPHIPFIFVTGKMGEDSAIQSLLNGATDYVLKSKPERLVPAIKRVLYEAELLKNRISSDKALRESEERYRGLLMNLNAGVVVHAPDSSIIMCNPKASELLGLSESQMMGKVDTDPHWKFLREDSTPLKQDNYPVVQVLSSKKSIKDFRLGVQRPETNDIVWLTVNGSPVLDKNNEISEVVISFLDITERKQAEDALHQEQNLMEILMDNIPDHLYFKDLESRFIRISKSNNESFHLKNSADAIGKTDFDFFTEEHARAAYLDEQEIIRTGKSLIREERETWADRPDTWASSTKMPLRNAEGNIIGTFGISRDISDRKRFEEEILKAKEIAEASDRLKTVFMRNISHEIRTPMNGILGFGQLMSDPDISQEEKDEFLVLVNQSSERLNNTITNIMDISLIVSGNQDVLKKNIACGAILDEAYDKFNQSCTQKGLTLSLQKQCINGELNINTDAELLNKILFHLIDNAIKFTKTGSIVVGCKVVDDYVEFIVKDSGIGISMKDQGHIFNNFIQGDNSNTRYHEGSGLGLSIAKGLTELLGGRIWIDSVVGEGSSFYFTIPIDQSCPEQAVNQNSSFDLPQKPLILVADDEETNCVLLARILRKEELEVLIVTNGQQAVDACRKNPSVSLILMDLKMPVMDGFEATRNIKAFNPHLPVIALTAYALGGDEKRVLEAGFDDYLTKPLKKELLMRKLIQYGITGSSNIT